MTSRSEKTKGFGFILLDNVLWSSFPIVAVLSFAALPAFASLAWSTLFAAAFLGAIVVYRGVWKEVFRYRVWTNAVLAALFIDVVFYGLFFLGLERTTPGNAAIIAFFEILTSYLFFNVFRGQKISLEHKVGAMVMILGGVIVLGPNFESVNSGDFLILAATFFAPVGNFFQLRARETGSSESVIFLRSLYAAPILFLLAAVYGQFADVESFQASLVFLLFNGVAVLGISRIAWLEGIRRISVVDANSLSCIEPLLTLFLAWMIFMQVPSVWQLSALGPIIVGVLLLTDRLRLRRG
jgi:drug/metabolite transporter (DMT)-like permease